MTLGIDRLIKISDPSNTLLINADGDSLVYAVDQIDVDRFRLALHKLMPQGQIKPSPQESSNIDGILEVVGKALALAYDEAVNTFEDSYPSSVGDFLEDWETELDLPPEGVAIDDTGVNGLTREERKDLILAWLNVSPYANRDFLEEISELAGFTIYIDYRGDYALPYDAASGDFELNETITAAGGATARIISLNGGVSPLSVTDVTGTFVDNELITGGTSGETANVDNLYPVDTATGCNFAGNLNLPYDNLSGAFTIFETITDQTSGATARIIGDDGSTLQLDQVDTRTGSKGAFADGNQILGATSGETADVDELTPDDAATGCNFTGLRPHYFRINGGIETLQYFQAGINAVGDDLATGNLPLQELITRLKQAHTVPVFSFTA